MGTKPYTLCAVATGSAYNQMQATLYTAPSGSGLPDSYTAFCPLPSGDVAAYDPTSGTADVYAVPSPGQGFAAATGSQTLTAGFAMLIPFAIGTQAMALGYTAASGTIQLYSLSGSTFTALNTYTGGGSNPPTTGLTTIVPYSCWGGEYLLCYDMLTGQVAIYQLTLGSNGVDVSLVWQPDKLWATGWTRFGPFQFGPENFFLKTNVDYKTVYIDHLMDEPSQGSHPAAEHLPLPLDLTAVAAFSLQGDPCFATYLASSGGVTLNRFAGNLQGWFQGAEVTAVVGGSLAVSLPGTTPTVLFY